MEKRGIKIEHNKNLFWVIVILIILLIVLVWFIVRSGGEEKEVVKRINGEFFDEQGKFIGVCDYETKDFVTRTNYYINEGLVGSCWDYSGPGGSGAKSGCDSDELLTELCEGKGCGTVEGKRFPKYTCKENIIECQTDSDCVPSECCHAESCVSKIKEPDCFGKLCTQVCSGPLDCGAGHCGCVNSKCEVVSDE